MRIGSVLIMWLPSCFIESFLLVSPIISVSTRYLIFSAKRWRNWIISPFVCCICYVCCIYSLMEALFSAHPVVFLSTFIVFRDKE